MFKFICQIVLSFVLVFSVFSQQTSKQPEEPALPAEIQAILFEAATLRPEFTIDIYLKLISSGRIKSKSKRKQLLEEAFYLSFYAKEKIPRKIISIGGEILTIRPTFISYTYKYKLDTLSLQIQVVSEMLKIDQVRAFALFNEISPNLAVKSLSCQDVLLYETSDFYELAGKISKDLFTPEQIKKGERISFLTSYIENMTSPSQISPIIKILISVGLTDNEMLNLANTFNKSLRQVFGDDRLFSHEMNFISMSSNFYDFGEKLKFSPALYNDFRASYKNYLVKNLQAKRCRDNVVFDERNSKAILAGENKIPETKLPYYIYIGNKFFFADSPLSSEDIKPSEIESFKFPQEYFTQGKSLQTIRNFRELQNREDKNKTDVEIKESVDWQQAFSKTLESVDELEESDGESEIDIFHQKSLLLRLFFREADEISLKKKVLDQYLKLLNNNRIQREYPPEWYLEFKDLLKEIDGVKSEQEQFLSTVKNANNSAIRLYLDLEKILKSEKNQPNIKTVTPSN